MRFRFDLSVTQEHKKKFNKVHYHNKLRKNSIIQLRAFILEIVMYKKYQLDSSHH